MNKEGENCFGKKKKNCHNVKVKDEKLKSNPTEHRFHGSMIDVPETMNQLPYTVF